MGIGYRLSYNLNDVHSQQVAPWGSLVNGLETGDGWLDVGELHLPMFLNGVRVLAAREALRPSGDCEMVKRTISLSTCSTSADSHQDLSRTLRIYCSGACDDCDDNFFPPEAFLKFWSGAHQLRKNCDQCEDAYFFNESAVGVADGVGGMAEYADWGIDVAAYAAELVQLAEKAMSVDSQCAYQAIASAEREATEYGASTALLCRLVGGALDVAGLGDSGFLLLRPVFKETTGHRHFTIIGRSWEQQHSWNFPYQLARIPTKLEAEIPIDCPRDSAADALRYVFETQPGDLVLAFSDGFSDNVFERDAISLVESVVGETGADTDPTVIAKALSLKAHANSIDTFGQTPFCEGATKQGHIRFGGKVDDITVIAAWVTAM